jgi:hypothetical protein
MQSIGHIDAFPPLGVDRVLEAKDGADGLSGNRASLMEKVVALRSSMKSLLISGYADGVAGSREQIANAGDFLEKPFHPDELARKAREILGRVSGTQEESSAANTSPGLPPDNSDTGTTHG